MSLYAVIDLHSTNSVLAVLDEADRPLRQCRLPNDLPTILKALEPFRDELTGVAVESTYNWYWLVDGLADHGYPMHLVDTEFDPDFESINARRCRRYPGAAPERIRARRRDRRRRLRHSACLRRSSAARYSRAAATRAG